MAGDLGSALLQAAATIYQDPLILAVAALLVGTAVVISVFIMRVIHRNTNANVANAANTSSTEKHGSGSKHGRRGSRSKQLVDGSNSSANNAAGAAAAAATAKPTRSGSRSSNDTAASTSTSSSSSTLLATNQTNGIHHTPSSNSLSTKGSPNNNNGNIMSPSSRNNRRIKGDNPSSSSSLNGGNATATSSSSSSSSNLNGERPQYTNPPRVEQAIKEVHESTAKDQAFSYSRELQLHYKPEPFQPLSPEVETGNTEYKVCRLLRFMCSLSLSLSCS